MKVKKVQVDDFDIQLTLNKEEAFRLCQLCGNITGNGPVRDVMDKIWNKMNQFFDYDLLETEDGVVSMVGVVFKDLEDCVE